jgi:hypothetical protein
MHMATPLFRIKDSMRDMTSEQALAEAVRRWGPSASISVHPSRAKRQQPGRLARYRCTVRNGMAGAFCSVEGQGHTWFEAFADARHR